MINSTKAGPKTKIKVVQIYFINDGIHYNEIYELFQLLKRKNINQTKHNFTIIPTIIVITTKNITLT